MARGNRNGDYVLGRLHFVSTATHLHCGEKENGREEIRMKKEEEEVSREKEKEEKKEDTHTGLHFP